MTDFSKPIAPGFAVLRDGDSVMQVSRTPLADDPDGPVHLYVSVDFDIPADDWNACGFLEALPKRLDALTKDAEERLDVALAVYRDSFYTETGEPGHTAARDAVTGVVRDVARLALEVRRAMWSTPAHRVALREALREIRGWLSGLQDLRSQLPVESGRSVLDLPAVRMPWLCNEPLYAVLGGVSPMRCVARARELLREYAVTNDEGTDDWTLVAAEALIDYGSSACMAQRVFYHEDDAHAWLCERLREAVVFGGFWLDRPCNAIGATGWDFMAGRCQPADE